MLVVHVHTRIRPERVEDFLATIRVNARASLAEPGVVRFDADGPVPW
jgi:quinol monooxygenase YgiN